MKSVVRSGMNSRCVCVPLHEALAGDAARADRDHALDDVEALAERIRASGRAACRRGASGSRAASATARRARTAVLARTRSARRCRPRRARSTGTISFHDRPAKKITYRPADSIRIAVPRSGCLTIRPTGTSSSSAGDHEVGRVQLAFALLEPPGQHQRHRDLQDLARLDHHAHVEPARRALLGDAEHRGRHQQRHADRVQRHRQPHQLLRRHLRHDEHDACRPAACCARDRRSACRGRSRPSTS